MAPADLHALVAVLAASGEKSKTAFFICGGVLAAWAVIVSVIGLRQPDFPRNLTGSRAVMGFSALLVLATVVTAVVTAQPPPKANEAKASAGGAKGPPSAPPLAGPQAQGGQPAHTLALAADPSGQLKYDKQALSAPAGAVKIDFANDAPVPHNVTIEQNGKALTATQTITQSKASVTAQLKPGTYTFYCSVDAHRQAGMVGTLKVG
jgi:plastocyanin